MALDRGVGDEVVKMSVVAKMRRVHDMSIKVDESTQKGEGLLLVKPPEAAISQLNGHR
jgi:hypothetical protein